MSIKLGLSSLNFESANSYSITVRATDAQGLTFNKSFTLTITNVNKVPVSLEFSANTIAENNAVAAVVGAFSTIDPDTGNTFTYSLVAGSGATDNTSFTIEANQLQAAAIIRNSTSFFAEGYQAFADGRY